MSASATSLAARCMKISTAALHNGCPGVLQWTSGLSHLKSRIAAGQPCTRLMSGGPVAESGPSSTSSVPAPTVRGVGLKQRLKATSSADLRMLINRTAAYDKLLSQSRVESSKELQTEHESQWTRLKIRVVAPYVMDDIVLQDAFAVIEAGPTQYKVVPDDKIYVHKMEGVDVDDIVQFNRVLLAGTPLNTVVGRPFVQNMRVIAAVEEQVRDATTYIYKRKRASGYRRFRGFRAELTALRILKVVGLEDYGLSVPSWQEGISTPLREMKSFGSQVRSRRRRGRAAQRQQGNDAVVAHLESGQDYGVSSYPEPISMPYKPISGN